MNKDRFILAFQHCDETAARGYNCVAAHMDYYVKNSRLFRNGPQSSKGWLVLCADDSEMCDIEPHSFARQLAGECSNCCFCGIIADIEGKYSEKCASVLNQLSLYLLHNNLGFIVPLQYADHVDRRCLIKIPSAVSGGSYCGLLDNCADKFGADHLVLELEVNCERFTIPCNSPEGIRLSRRDLDELNGIYLPMSFFSHDLQTNYFTYIDGNKQFNYVLYDDIGSLRSKLRQSELRGICRFIALYPEIQPWLRELI